MKQLFLRTVLLLIVGCGITSAQQGISLEGVTNSLNDTLLLAGAEHRFLLRITNMYPAPFKIWSGFRLWSDDGAQWSYPYRDTIADSSVRFLWVDSAFEDLFDEFYVTQVSTDGMGSDTLGFTGTAEDSTKGLPAYYEGDVYEIIIQTREEDKGKHICLDSSWFPPDGKWQWLRLTPG